MEYQFTINDFAGPLDLLLHLVKTAKMDIYTINIKDLIDEYLEFLNKMDNLDIDVASEYLVMAAELIHLKSRMLINEPIEETSDEYNITSEDDLRNKLMAYEQIKDITDTLKDLASNRQDLIEKAPDNLKEYADEDNVMTQELTADDLYQAILAFQERLKYEEPLNTKITHKEITIAERTNDIRSILAKQGKINFFDLFSNPTKEYVVVTFLSILDMSKNREILIKQEANFKPITIEKRGSNE
jgi:segregation and condensation protein A